MNNEFNKSTSDLIKKELLKNKYFTDKKMPNEKVYIRKMNFDTHDIEFIAMFIRQNFEYHYNHNYNYIFNIQSIETYFYETSTADDVCVKINYVKKSVLDMYFNEKHIKAKQDSNSTDIFIALCVSIGVLFLIITSFWSFLCQ